MSVPFFLLVGALVVVAVYVVNVYNGLVRLKHNISKAWSAIDVLLKQRHDELPKLIEVCKQYKQFEQATLEKVMNARAAVANAQEAMNVGALGTAESALRAGVGKLLAVVEAYPELKANQTFANLASRITQLENAIADRRELYNESVNQNNVRLDSVPDGWVAGFGPFKAFDLLSFEKEELSDVDVKGLFK